jgi:Fe-S cluster assembly protein SufD
VNLGGGLVRIAPTVRFAGPGGETELLGVSFAGSGEHFESRLYVDHGVAECRSNVLYKNALLGETARTVWIGDVRIRPEATGTSTYEMNRNLLLSDGARADSVPNLEIETGEIVGAGHASATGRFDDLQLFYLMSRGIDAEQAQRLVVRGFFADVVDRIGLPELQHRIMSAVETRLGFAPAAETELETV